jgi:hypothetical protein
LKRRRDFGRFKTSAISSSADALMCTEIRPVFIKAWTESEGKKDQENLAAAANPQPHWPWSTAADFVERLAEASGRMTDRHWHDREGWNAVVGKVRHPGVTHQRYFLRARFVRCHGRSPNDGTHSPTGLVP